MSKSATPWTDANEEDGWNPCGWAVDSNLVRELERELIAARQELKAVTEQRDEAREENAKLREIAESAINYLDQSYRDGFSDEANELRYELNNLRRK